MLGGGVELERLKVEAARKQLTNVVFLPFVPMAQVGAYLQIADALLVHLRKDPLFEITIPSKTQAYMAVGKPLLMAVNGDAADLVKKSGGGVVAESESPQAMAQAAQALANTSTDVLSAMGQQAKAFYQKNLGLAVGAQRFGELFKQLARKS
jgi:glycosyltransferase involved in cell wall biosynthesis